MMRRAVVSAIVLALAAVAGVVIFSSPAEAEDVPESLAPTLRQMRIEVESLSESDRARVRRTGVTASDARELAIQEEPTATSAVVYVGRMTDLESLLPSGLPRIQDRLVYVVYMTDVEVQLHGPNLDDRPAEATFVRVPFLYFVDALTGEGIMGSSA